VIPKRRAHGAIRDGLRDAFPTYAGAATFHFIARAAAAIRSS
jgi:hypothetical protein